METTNRGGMSDGDVERFASGHEDFMRARHEGLRDRWIVKHPYTGEHIDAVDYQAEIDARHAAGLEGYGFWSTPLPEVDN